MKVLHLLASGGIGGIEVLCKEYGNNSKNENYFLFMWGKGCIAEEMRQCGNHVIELDASKKNLLGPLKKIFELCKKENISTVVVHHSAPILYLYLIAVKRYFPKIKTVAYAHGNAEDMYREKEKKGLWLRRTITKKSLCYADCVIAISNSVKKSLIEKLHIPDEKIMVIYNGVDITKFTRLKKEKYDIPEIIFVGRLIPEKGVQVLLNSLSRIPETISYHCSIVGEGIHRQTLENLAVEYGLCDKIVFLGNRRDIPELLAQSDIFVHTPLWEEGFGITIVEAMASGLTCICSRSGAISEIIDDKFNGYLIEKNNAFQLRELLVEVLQNYYSEYNCKMRQSAVEKAQVFSIYNYVNLIDDLIVNRRTC